MSRQGTLQINSFTQHVFTLDNFLFYRGNLETLKFNMLTKLSVYQTGYVAFYKNILHRISFEGLMLSVLM